jgi:hypothetical protein
VSDHPSILFFKKRRDERKRREQEIEAEIDVSVPWIANWARVFVAGSLEHVEVTDND